MLGQFSIHNPLHPESPGYILFVRFEYASLLSKRFRHFKRRGEVRLCIFKLFKCISLNIVLAFNDTGQTTPDERRRSKTEMEDLQL